MPTIGSTATPWRVAAFALIGTLVWARSKPSSGILPAARRPGEAVRPREAAGARRGALRPGLPAAHPPPIELVAPPLLRGGLRLAPRHVRPRVLQLVPPLVPPRNAALCVGRLLLAVLRALERTSAPEVPRVPLRLAPTRGASSMTRSEEFIVSRRHRSPPVE